MGLKNLQKQSEYIRADCILYHLPAFAGTKPEKLSVAEKMVFWYSFIQR